MRSSRRRTALVLFLLLAASACGSDGDAAAPAAPDTAPTTAAAPATTTTAPSRSGAVLEEPGAQPRQPLVLRLAPGTTTKVALVNKLSLQLTLDGRAIPEQPGPATRTVLDQRIERVDPDGTAHYSVTLADVSVVSTAGVDPDVLREVRAGLSQLNGLRGTGAIDAQGDTREVTVDASTITDPTIRSTVDSVSSQVGNLSAPFPKEPVGVGARWTVKRSATINGLTMDTTTRYTLRSRTGDRYELDVVQEAVSPPGPVALPNLPAGARAAISDFSVQSKGSLSGDLTRALPVRSSLNGTGGGTFTLTAGTERSTLRQQMTLELTTSPA